MTRTNSKSGTVSFMLHTTVHISATQCYQYSEHMRYKTEKKSFSLVRDLLRNFLFLQLVNVRQFIIMVT
jgi:hypothetical protein